MAIMSIKDFFNFLLIYSAFLLDTYVVLFNYFIADICKFKVHFIQI